MSNEVNNYTPSDLLLIDSKNPLEVEWWSQRFGVSVQQLRTAIRIAGLITGDVQKQLQR